MGYKERFIEVFKNNVHRDGSDQLLSYLERSDFFTAPASTRFHLSCEGGLCIHSLNVYDRLVQLLNNQADKERCFPTGVPDEEINETVAIAALLHDLCKVNFYKTSFRNAKNEQGKWEQVPYYTIEDNLPYGHGEKSVYIISAYMRLTRDEAFAIRYHMGFSANDDPGNVGKALEMFPLAYALCAADMEAAYFCEGSPKK